MDEWMRYAIERDYWYHEDIQTRAEHIADRLEDAYPGEMPASVHRRLAVPPCGQPKTISVSIPE
jgi:hypothetical protein